MFDQTDQLLSEWASSVLRADTIDDVQVLFTPPTNADAYTEPSVHLYLLESTPTLPPRDTTRHVLQIRLTYLVTVTHADPTTAHAQVAALMFAAMEHPSFETVVEPLPLTLWETLGVLPRAAFRVHMYVQRERDHTPAKPVLQPLVLQAGEVNDVYGQLLSEDDTPLAGARVRCAALNRQTTTDANGRFRLSGMVGTPMLEVRAKQATAQVTVDQPTTPQEPFVIRIDPLRRADA